MTAGSIGSPELLFEYYALNNKPQGQRSLAAAIAHNKRTLNEQAYGRFDPQKSADNFALLGLHPDPKTIRHDAINLLAAQRYTSKRKDAAIAVEIVLEPAARI